MKKADVRIGAVYVAKVSGKLAPVRIESENMTYPYTGWEARNLNTGCAVFIRGAGRLRRRVNR